MRVYSYVDGKYRSVVTDVIRSTDTPLQYCVHAPTDDFAPCVERVDGARRDEIKRMSTPLVPEKKTKAKNRAAAN